MRDASRLHKYQFVNVDEARWKSFRDAWEMKFSLLSPATSINDIKKYFFYHEWWYEMWDDFVIILMRLWNFNDFRVALFLWVRNFIRLAGVSVKRFLVPAWLASTAEENNHNACECPMEKFYCRKLLRALVDKEIVHLTYGLHWLFSRLIEDHFSSDAAISIPKISPEPLLNYGFTWCAGCVRFSSITRHYDPIIYLRHEFSIHIFTFFAHETHFDKIS